MRVRGLRVAAIERGEQSLSEDEEDQLLYTRFYYFFVCRTQNSSVSDPYLFDTDPDPAF